MLILKKLKELLEKRKEDKRHRETLEEMENLKTSMKTHVLKLKDTVHLEPFRVNEYLRDMYDTGTLEAMENIKRTECKRKPIKWGY